MRLGGRNQATHNRLVVGSNPSRPNGVFGVRIAGIATFLRGGSWSIEGLFVIVRVGARAFYSALCGAYFRLSGRSIKQLIWHGQVVLLRGGDGITQPCCYGVLRETHCKFGFATLMQSLDRRNAESYYSDTE